MTDMQALEEALTRLDDLSAHNTDEECQRIRDLFKQQHAVIEELAEDAAYLHEQRIPIVEVREMLAGLYFQLDPHGSMLSAAKREIDIILKERDYEVSDDDDTR